MPLNPNAKPFQCPKVPLNPNANPFSFPIQTYLCKPCWQWQPIDPTTTTRVNLNHNNVGTRKLPRVTRNRIPVSSRTKHVVSGCGLQKRSSSSSSKGNVIPFPSCSSFDQKPSCTTVMIRNIPNQFRRGTLVSILRRHCREENNKSEHKSEFDFVYLPMDFHQYWKNKRVANLGYAFVNFTSYVAALRFYQYYHNREWRVKSNNKICEVSCAKIQGKEALERQFKNSVFWCHTDMYLPVVFVPACDGVVLPKTISVGHRVCAPSRKPRTKYVIID